MTSWHFHIPTHTVTARGGLSRVAGLLPAGAARVLVVCGKHSARAHGFLDRAVRSLEEAGKTAVVFDGVEENPALDTIDRGVAHAQAERTGAVIGIGGGSALDAAKAVAVCAGAGMAVRAALKADPAPCGMLPFVAVPTTAGTGSEATQYALLTDDARGDKLNLATSASFPAAALLDAELTATMPRDLTRDTGLDALSHAVESMLSERAQPLSSAMAEAAIARVARHLPRVLDAPGDLDAREEMLVAANLAGRAIAHTGTAACHALSYHFTLRHGVHHGRACGLLLPALVEWCRRRAPGKTERIELLLGMPVGRFIEECGLHPATDVPRLADGELEAMAAQAAARSSTRATPGAPGADDLKAMLYRVWTTH
ncbi:iron-containing alcohol dehydrogenase [bacterium]|nr:iron-containing alcohol dehydrogenase [bacterium]